ncbi:MAG: ATP-binding protein, partial [Slackia sp.]
ARIELLGACEVEIRRTEERIEASTEELARCNRSLDEAIAGIRALRQRGGVYAADESSEATVLRRLEGLEKESVRLERRIESAQDVFDRARAQAEARDEQDTAAFSKSDKAILACCVVLFLAGVATAVKGLSGSDAFLVCVGVAVGACAVGVGSFLFSQRKKKSRTASAKKGEGEVSKARRVLEVCEQDELMFSLRVQEELDAMGLAEAQGSIRNARIIMESPLSAFGAARDRGRIRALEARKTAEREALDREAARRRELFCRIECAEDQGLEGVHQVLEEALEERNVLLESMRRNDIRLGELRQCLFDAERSRGFDLLKTQRAQIITRKNEEAENLAKLLLARRVLARAIEEWKSESVPEVYARASHLLSLMTGGTWVEIRMKDDGRLVAVDVSRGEREPRFLSMGTCQQLYLALRIALLECVEGVGNAVPVLADDILVNFDDERRKGAVRALSELAEKRQVILFTCHKEIVEAVRQYADGHTMVAL